MQLQPFVITYIITSPDTFVYLCGFELPSWATFFQSEELLLVFLVRPICQPVIVFLFRNTFISLLYFKDTIAGYETFSWQIFPFNTLNTSSLCHLVSSVSKSAVNFWGSFVCAELFFSCCFQEFVFAFDVSSSMCFGVCLCVYPTWNIEFLGYKVNIFHRIWEISSHYFFKYFFYSHFVLSLHVCW